jgi:hypothetical protein
MTFQTQPRQMEPLNPLSESDKYIENLSRYHYKQELGQHSDEKISRIIALA